MKFTQNHLHKQVFRELTTDEAVAAPHGRDTLPSWLGFEPVPAGIQRRVQSGEGFVGEAIHTHLFDSNSNRLALVGAPGTGKSTALANYIDSYRSQYDTVVFINAENEIVLSDSFQRVAVGLGLKWANVLKQHDGKAHVAALELLKRVSVCVSMCVCVGGVRRGAFIRIRCEC